MFFVVLGVAYQLSPPLGQAQGKRAQQTWITTRPEGHGDRPRMMEVKVTDTPILPRTV